MGWKLVSTPRPFVFCRDSHTILSAARSEEYSRTQGHGSEHEGFAKTCFCKELWLLRRNAEDVREAGNSLWGIGVGSIPARAEIQRLSPAEGLGNLEPPMSLGWEGPGRQPAFPGPAGRMLTVTSPHPLCARFSSASNSQNYTCC